MGTAGTTVVSGEDNEESMMTDREQKSKFNQI